ncbi:MAG: dehydrogenase [Alphaproteobacteria bacterium]|nr:MAG: dehydrogenase [Alphaproteobacteria bacterium]
MVSGRVRIGMLGGGMISQIAHLPFYLDDPRCEVVALAESRPSLVEALTPVLGAGRLLRDHDEMLARTDIDAVVISAPRPATGPLTLAALEAGKHVLAEKPMAHSAEQARRLAEAAATLGLIYAVGYMKRYDPGIEAGKRLVDAVRQDGRLGRLLFARFYDYANSYAVPPPAHTRPTESRPLRFPTWPTFPDWLPERFREVYAWFLNAGSHDVNLLRYFFPDEITLLDARYEADSVTATLRAGGCLIGLDVVKAAPGVWLEGAEFVFERGRIALVIPSPMAVDGVTQVSIDDAARGAIGEAQPCGQGWSFARQARGFVDALTGGARPLTEGVDGLADMQLMERIWRKAAAA